MMTTSAASANLANWICNSLALAILLLRLGCIRYQYLRFNASAYLVMLALGVLSSRVALQCYIIRYGTVNDLVESDQRVSASQLAKAQTGSMLTLAARVLITTFYWLMCMLLLLVYRSLLESVDWIRTVIRICWGTIAVTYVAVILTTFLECQPFHLYWQLHPNPGSCVRAYGQLMVQGVSNIIIDLGLITISIPILRTQLKVWPRNLQLGCVFVLGFFTMIVTCVRLKYTIASHSSQNTRILWASIQALFATVVANASSIYGTLILRRRKNSASRSRSRGSTTVQSSNNPLQASDIEHATIDKAESSSNDVVSIEWKDASERDSIHARDLR